MLRKKKERIRFLNQKKWLLNLHSHKLLALKEWLGLQRKRNPYIPGISVDECKE